MVLRPVIRAAVLVTLVSLALRIAWAAFATVTPVSDFAGYDFMAKRMLSEWEFGGANWRAYRTPGYPGFLTILYAVFGSSWTVVGFAQAILSSLTSGMIVLLAARAVSIRASVLAGLIHTFAPTAVAYVPVLASETLGAVWVVLGVLCLALADGHNGWRRGLAVAASGAACGLLLLTRPAGLFFVPGWLLLVVYSPRDRVLRIRSAVLFVSVLALVLSPWLIRNYRLGLGPFTLSTVGTLNLWMGNNDFARSGGYCARALDDRLNEMPEKQRESAYAALTLDWIRTHPRRYVALCRTRLARHFGTTVDGWAGRYLVPTADIDRAHVAADRHARNLEPAPAQLRRKSAEARRRNACFLACYRVTVAPLTLVALALSFARWRNFAVVVLPVSCYVIGIGLTFGAERFRMLSDPFFFVPMAALLSDAIFGSRDLGVKPSRALKIAIAAIALFASFLGQETGLWQKYYILAPSSAPAPDVSELTLTPLAFEQPAGQYQSGRWTRGGAAVRLALEDYGLRCEVTGSDNKSVSQYGGIEFPAVSPKAIRLDLTWINPESIFGVFLYGYDASGGRQALWSWDFEADTRPAEVRAVYTLVPGRPSAHFVVREGDANILTDIHVFVRVRPNTKAGFIVHKLEIASE
ncbi:MAG: ArnT family glycosyltransferase [Phycisphaerae bacterium]